MVVVMSVVTVVAAAEKTAAVVFWQTTSVQFAEALVTAVAMILVMAAVVARSESAGFVPKVSRFQTPFLTPFFDNKKQSRLRQWPQRQ